MLELKALDDLQHHMEALSKKTRFFSFARFVVSVITLVLVICFLSLDQFLLYLILSLASITVLLTLIILTNPVYHQLHIMKNLENVYKKHELRRKGSYQGFSDDGREFVDFEDYKELDLDLLGPKSLFQYLCAAKSKLGRQALAQQLKQPEAKSETFRSCVAKLATTEDSLKLEASLMNITGEAKNCDYDELLGVLHQKIQLPKMGWVIFAVSYLCLFGLLGYFLVQNIQPWYLLFFLPIHFFLARHFSKNEMFDLASIKYSNLLSAYQTLAEDITKVQIEDPYLQSLRDVLKEELDSLVRMKKLFEMLSYRQNFIFSFLGNGLFFLDFWIALKFNADTKKIHSIQESISAIAEIELMLSLATIGIDNEVYTQGIVSDHIHMEDAYHPLVKNCISNSFALAGGVVLTGSNMSGKTTFQRTLGVNQILFNAGGLVCASYFSAPFLEVVTSLRANDMLQEGISTFYAEIKRMKAIMTTSQQQRNTLVLVDEIFKGTNAKDRIYGSLEIIKKLLSEKVFFIITTHDFEICDAPGILNYHFDEQFVDDKILFDYKIKDGKCTKTNAIYLLRMSGVLDNA